MLPEAPMRSIHRQPAMILVLLAGAAIFASACGGDDDGYGGSSTKAGTTATSAIANTAAVLKVGTSSKGSVLTDGAGMTLYTFKSDAATPGKSACSGSCAATWPALTSTSPAAPGAPAGSTGAVGLITRDDGAKQVTYNGSPLYRYSGDTASGSVAGDGIGNVWFAVIIGVAASPTTSTSPTASTSGGSYNY
jgi:predicted lipoprotein with Yx(FWY)xxD motif